MSFEYELKDSFEYTHKGNLENASFLTLSAPTGRNIKECAFLKQAFFQSIPKPDSETLQAAKELAQESDNDDQGKIEADEIMMVLSRSKDVTLASVLVTARELFTSGVVMVDGDEKLTKPLVDLMSITDLEKMTGEYLANFMLASL